MSKFFTKITLQGLSEAHLVVNDTHNHILRSLALASRTISSHQNILNGTAGTVLPANSTCKKILLIEDNYFNRQMMEDYLVFCGYQVLSLEFGSGFFQALAEFQPNLVLLDLKLPDVDGYILLEQINQKPNWQDIPVIVVSAYAFKADRQRALDLGATRYFIKPIGLRDLKQAIEEELSRF